MKIIKHESPYGVYELSLQFGKYKNGQISINLFDVEDGMPYAKATICLDDGILKDNEVAIKNYSENEGILETLIQNRIVEEPHAYIQSGFVKIPICKLLTSI